MFASSNLKSARSERLFRISASPHISSRSAKCGPTRFACTNFAIAPSKCLMPLPDESRKSGDHKRDEQSDGRFHGSLRVIAEAAKAQMRNMEIVLLARVFDLQVE